MHAGVFENKADSPTFTKIHQTPQKQNIYKSKTRRQKPGQDQENQVCKRRREKGERGRRTYIANADDLVDKKTTTKKRTMELQCILLALPSKARILCSDSL
jgi:hypothetical protein